MTIDAGPLFDSLLDRVEDKGPDRIVRVLLRPLLWTMALLMAACGDEGRGSGSGDDGGDPSIATASLFIRWQPTAGADGYVIHWGTASGSYGHALDVGVPTASGSDDVVSFLLDGVETPATIYIALTSYDAAGAMSRFSNELSAVVP